MVQSMSRKLAKSQPRPKPLEPEIDHSFEMEVTQDLRQEQAAEFFKKYGVIIALVIAAIVAGVAYYQWQTVQQRDVNAAASAPFDTYLNDNNSDTFLVAENAEGYQLLARFIEAKRMADKDQAKGLALYQAIIDDSAVPAIYQQQAAVMAGYEALNATAGMDKALQAHLIDIETSSSAWQYLAREVLGLNALKANEMREARSYILALTEDNNAPEAIRGRASDLLPLADSANQ